MTRLDLLESKLDSLIVGQANHNAEQRAMAKDLADIKYGLYGNEKNNHKGVMKEMEERELRITSLEKSRDRNKYTVAGFLAAVQLLFVAVWEWFRK